MAASLFVPLCASGAEDGSPKPNILFIVLESVRADHVGCYGYGRATTPTLDRLAAEGARFEQAIAACSWTTPSVMTMFTSVPPAVHNVRTHSLPLRRTGHAGE